MSTPIMILGPSGGGKSASMRNLDPATTLLIQAIGKPLPFERGREWKVFNPETKEGNVFVTDKAADILALMQKTKRRRIILDDFQYVMANEFMRRSEEKGYDKFTQIGRNAWDILSMAAALPHDARVYILTHTDVSDSGLIKAKTIGRMLDEKITIEGMFTVVMRTVARDGEYFFTTQTNGNDPVKTPMNMFADELISNDLAAVDKRICEYWTLTP